MLLNSVFYAVLMALIAGTLLSSGLAVTRAVVHHAAQRVLAGGYSRAATAIRQGVAPAAQAGSLAQMLPVIPPLPPQCEGGSAPCAYRTSATVTLLSYTSAPEQSCSAQNSCLRSEQHNPFVLEGRLRARVSVTVSAPGGEQLAEQTSTLVFRTLRTPPYLLLAGVRDVGFDDQNDGGEPGDDGGVRVVGDSCVSGLPGTSDDTAVHVVYRRTTDERCSSGDIWAEDQRSAGAREPWP